MMRRGFTIVELLVVIVVVAILATLTIVSYRYIVAQSIEATMYSDLEGARNSIAALKAGKKTYPDDASAANGGQGLKASSGNQLTYAGMGTGYVVMITNPKIPTGLCLKTGEISECSVNWSKISTGMGSTCGVVEGKAYCWGSNWYGQLGNGTTNDAIIPTAVDTSGVLGGKVVTDISIGDGHACAVADGAAYCWGAGGRGQLGNNTTTSSNTPVAVDTSGVLAGKTVTKVVAGGDETCLIAGAAAYCFGDTYHGALGNGVTTSSTQSTPVAVDATGVLAGKTVTDITVGQYYAYNACAVASGKAYCWGDNDWGNLGTGTDIDSAVPVAVLDSGVLAGKTVTSIAMYEYHACAVANGAAYCWGGNGDGYLGNGEENLSAIYPPVAVSTSGALSGKTVTSIAPGDYTTCAIANGLPYCWGAGNYGQRGDGQSGTGTPNATTPTAVTISGSLVGKTATMIATGYSHSCVLAGNLPFCWGDSWAGELGDGKNVLSAVPVLVLPAI